MIRSPGLLSILYKHRQQSLIDMRASRFLASSSPSTSSTEPSDPSTPTTNTTKRRRQRHSFNNLESIPSFQDFQQQVQIRSLYRKYLRAIAPIAHREELLQQIQREFRTLQESNWHVKRSLSDGQRRLKELHIMVGTTARLPKTTKEDTALMPLKQTKKAPDNPWPWQR